MSGRQSAKFTFAGFVKLVTRWRSRPEIDVTIANADSHRAKGEWKRAAELYADVVRIAGHRADVWVQLGHAWKESGDIQRAKMAYQTAAQLEPDNAETHLHLGHLLKNTGQLKAAGEAFLNCLKADQDTHDAYEQLSHLGWSRRDILANVHELGSRKFEGAAGDWDNQTLRTGLYEAVRQMTASGTGCSRRLPERD